MLTQHLDRLPHCPLLSHGPNLHLNLNHSKPSFQPFGGDTYYWLQEGLLGNVSTLMVKDGQST